MLIVTGDWKYREKNYYDWSLPKSENTKSITLVTGSFLLIFYIIKHKIYFKVKYPQSDIDLEIWGKDVLRWTNTCTNDCT